MNELSELYREVILDHNRRPRNFGRLEGATSEANGNNPLCGDGVLVSLKVHGDTIEDIRFHGCGCAISQASASVMTEAVKGKTQDEARALFNVFHQMVTTEGGAAFDELDPLASFAGVREFPVRVKCATLAWHVLIAALDKSNEKVTTE